MATRKATPTNILDDIFNTPAPANDRGAIVWLPLDRITDNPYQTRSAYDDVSQLADSISSLRSELPATNGLQQLPVARLVAPQPGGQLVALDRLEYQQPAALRQRLIADPALVAQLHFGHRRWRAFQLLAATDPSYHEMPVMLAYADDVSMWRHVVTENAQRADINPVDQARALRVAIDTFGLTLDQAGQPFGFTNRSTISNKLRILDLPAKWLALVATGDLGERHARALLRLAPAPALLDQVASRANTEHTTASELERDVERAISSLPAVLEVTTEIASVYGPRQTDPAFPIDWQPAPAPLVLGACAGCGDFVRFSGEKYSRCAQPVDVSSQRCHTAKEQQWRQLERQRQATAVTATLAAAAAAAAAASQAPQPGATSAAAAVDGMVATLAAAAQPGATSELAIVATAAAPAAVTADRFDEYSTHFFGASYSAPRELVTGGHCGAEQCKCFVIAYKDSIDNPDRLIRPDPEHAPHMCAGCTNGQRLAARHRALTATDATRTTADNKRAEHKTALDVLNGAISAFGGATAMLAVPAFLEALALRLGVKVKPGADLAAAIVANVARDECTSFIGAANATLYQLDRTRSFVERLAPPAQPAAQPGAGSELATDWRSVWSNDDDALYTDIASQAPPASELATVLAGYSLLTKPVIWRLIDECSDRAVRGQLWQVANAIP
jgi:ParB/RepB/Spo0J family partition protein